ncbi:DNA repair and recombination protein RAD54-like [Trichinella spiralis]|uniref:DNA repair and recombination protein RAD54-like n=1 Tax=Trichinella spiralis TaxID=6334 RepID=A0ABR3KZG7_TRISP
MTLDARMWKMAGKEAVRNQARPYGQIWYPPNHVKCGIVKSSSTVQHFKMECTEWLSGDRADIKKMYQLRIHKQGTDIELEQFSLSSKGDQNVLTCSHSYQQLFTIHVFADAVSLIEYFFSMEKWNQISLITLYHCYAISRQYICGRRYPANNSPHPTKGWALRMISPQVSPRAVLSDDPPTYAFR